jgi:hypothetical protein
MLERAKQFLPYVQLGEDVFRQVGGKPLNCRMTVRRAVKVRPIAGAAAAARASGTGERTASPSAMSSTRSSSTTRPAASERCIAGAPVATTSMIRVETASRCPGTGMARDARPALGRGWLGLAPGLSLLPLLNREHMGHGGAEKHNGKGGDDQPIAGPVHCLDDVYPND